MVSMVSESGERPYHGCARGLHAAVRGEQIEHRRRRIEPDRFPVEPEDGAPLPSLDHLELHAADYSKNRRARMCATDIASGAVDLEFALVADGVANDKLYPIDLNRAFKALDRVTVDPQELAPGTGVLSALMLADKEVVLGALRPAS